LETIRPIEVGGMKWRPRGDVLGAVIGPTLGGSLGPARVDGQEAGRRERRAAAQLVTSVRDRRHLIGLEPATGRVPRVVDAAIGVLPIERGRLERRGLVAPYAAPCHAERLGPIAY